MVVSVGEGEGAVKNTQFIICTDHVRGEGCIIVSNSAHCRRKLRFLSKKTKFSTSKYIIFERFRATFICFLFLHQNW